MRNNGKPLTQILPMVLQVEGSYRRLTVIFQGKGEEHWRKVRNTYLMCSLRQASHHGEY